MLHIITENPAYEEILETKFPNRCGDYLEMLLKKANVDTFIVTCNEFLLKDCESSVIVTLGATPTRMLLELKKSYKLKEYVGKTFVKESKNIVPWYSLEYLLLKGKKLEQETIKLLGKIYETIVVVQKERPSS